MKEIVRFLDKTAYEKKKKKIKNHYTGTNWDGDRWYYHKEVSKIAEKLDIDSPSDVLELGSLGMQIVENSDTMDYDKHWKMQGIESTYNWDVRETPWPVEDNRYKLLISLRVWQHLGEYQEIALKEAMRISEYVLLVIPFTYPNNKGMTKDMIESMIKPNILLKYKELKNNGLYLIKRK